MSFKNKKHAVQSLFKQLMKIIYFRNQILTNKMNAETGFSEEDKKRIIKFEKECRELLSQIAHNVRD